LSALRDQGYFVEFEHPNEAAELMFRKVNQKMLQGVLTTENLPAIFGWTDLVPDGVSDMNFSNNFLDLTLKHKLNGK
jgi:hypothetical protein